MQILDEQVIKTSDELYADDQEKPLTEEELMDSSSFREFINLTDFIISIS